MGDAAVYDLAAVVAERDALAAEKADCEKFLKEGERLDECLERWRADALAVLELLTQEKVKSESLAAEVAQADAEYQDAITLAQMNKDRLDAALAEVAKLRDDAALHDETLEICNKQFASLRAEVERLSAACAVKDAALRAATTLVRDCIPSGPDLHNACAALEAALSDTAGTNWIDATGAVETMALPEVADGNAWVDDTPLPAAWVGKSVLIVVKP